MTKLGLQLAGEWLLTHTADEKTPILKTCAFLKSAYSDSVDITNETDSNLEINVDETAVSTRELCYKIRAFLKKHYSDFSDEYLSAYGFDENISSGAYGGDFNEGRRYTFGIEEEQTVNEIENLISGEEFKVLAREIRLLAPTLKQSKTENVFFKQRYLYSINDGCCLEEYLNLYAELLVSLKLLDEYSVVVKKLAPLKPNCDDSREVLLREIKFERRGSVICIDISDWMNQVNGLEFREFLSKLLIEHSDATLVFRIPFVDKEVSNNIARALNDMMFIRQLSFPPFTNEEIGRFAYKELKKYGFSMNEKAWSGFYARIREESSDGRFYGADTIVKVVEELIYDKQVENSRNGTCDKIITEKNTDKLCDTVYADNVSGMEMLDSLIGTDAVKSRILEIISQIELVRKTPALGSPGLHMRFVGNPGTGKTTVARIIGKILKEKGILRVGEFHEHAGRDFCGRYIGETAPKTMSLCRAAYGSVLFIDESYSLYREDNEKDYGKEALDTLVAEMENHRTDFVVIMAGYTDEMDKMLKGNVGLESRMPYTLEFPNFTKSQLFDIFVSMCKKSVEYDDTLISAAREYFENLDEGFISSKEFSNARFVRNLFERVCAKAALRCQLEENKKIVLTEEDFMRSAGDKEFLIKKKRLRIGF